MDCTFVCPLRIQNPHRTRAFFCLTLCVVDGCGKPHGFHTCAYMCVKKREDCEMVMDGGASIVWNFTRRTIVKFAAPQKRNKICKINCQSIKRRIVCFISAHMFNEPKVTIIWIYRCVYDNKMVDCWRSTTVTMFKCDQMRCKQRQIHKNKQEIQ